jgi:L-fuconolactonase
VPADSVRTSDEVVIERHLPIIDPHHHMWPNGRYGRADLEFDIARGHNVLSTIFVECGVSYRTTGPRHLMPVGETEWVRGQRGSDGICTGVISHADMYLGPRVGEVLDAHLAAGGAAFKGIRHIVAWDPHPDIFKPPHGAPQGALRDPRFQSGTAALAARNLIFETWLYFTQLHDVVALAQAQPDLKIVVDHLGGPVCTGPYSADRGAMLSQWRRGIAALADHPNVFLKLGGIGFRPFVEPALLLRPRSSWSLAECWRHEILYCIEQLSAKRCMFESNFPVDSHLADYVMLWNTFKRISADLPADDRYRLFYGTASDVYKIGGQQRVT